MLTVPAPLATLTMRPSPQPSLFSTSLRVKQILCREGSSRLRERLRTSVDGRTEIRDRDLHVLRMDLID